MWGTICEANTASGLEERTQNSCESCIWLWGDCCAAWYVKGYHTCTPQQVHDSGYISFLLFLHCVMMAAAMKPNHLCAPSLPPACDAEHDKQKCSIFLPLAFCKKYFSPHKLCITISNPTYYFVQKKVDKIIRIQGKPENTYASRLWCLTTFTWWHLHQDKLPAAPPTQLTCSGRHGAPLHINRLAASHVVPWARRWAGAHKPSHSQNSSHCFHGRCPSLSSVSRSYLHSLSLIPFMYHLLYSETLTISISEE